jgi:hypothetical protein
MSVPADPAEEARTWFTQASEDLSAARHLADMLGVVVGPRQGSRSGCRSRRPTLASSSR